MAKLGLQMARRLHSSHDATHVSAGMAKARTTLQSLTLDRLTEKPLSNIRSFFERRSSGSGSSSNDCSNNNTGTQCQKASATDNVTLPVALGVCIPVLFAILIFIWGHRRHVKKLRSEDANDPHKSLDFGWDPAATASGKGKKGKKNQPEMGVTNLRTEKDPQRPRGLSMDLDLESPYVLPHGLQGSRESLHSMSRTIHSHDDRYRPATQYYGDDSKSTYSYNTSRKGRDDSSSYTASGSINRGPRDDMNQDLLGNAQRMSRSMPSNQRVPVPEIRMPEAAKTSPRKPLPARSNVPPSTSLSPNASIPDPRESSMSKDGANLGQDNDYLGAHIHSREPSLDHLSQKGGYPTPNEMPPTSSTRLLQTRNRKPPPPTISTNAAAPRPPRNQSLHASSQPSLNKDFLDESSDYGDGFKVTPPSPRTSQQEHNGNRRSSQAYMPPIDEYTLGADDIAGVGYDIRRLSMGVRPLPPDDPTDNPEQRANRIRSFYKEYFDDSKPKKADYYEDYDEQFLGDGAILDPASGQFVTSHVQYPEPQHTGPYGRRAMTPPPRAPPRFRRPHAATMSGSSRMITPGPRAFSSASGRFGPSGRGTPKKAQPPPQPLRVLPSPHLLKEDSFALPIDFAPPTSAKDRQAGRPESPRGGLRPYSPRVPAHVPLQTSFDDLAVMPSPHSLRKSGTFTALDFAPSPRFRGLDSSNNSDAGSIRSNGTAMSARQQHAIRAGAYRVSRIPKEVVGTKNDLMGSLKPTWNMHNNDSQIGVNAK